MDFIQNIQLKKKLLTKNELKACNAILEDILVVQEFSFTDLSKKIGITKASILRFCKKIGYSGYNEFKFECIRYVNSINNLTDLEFQDKTSNDIKMISNTYINVINNFNKTIDESSIFKLIESIKESERIRVVGMVNASIAAIQLRYALLMFGREITVINSSEELLAVDMSIREKDLTIIFSVSSKDESVQKAIEVTKNSDGKVSLITMNSNSKYKDLVDSFIFLPNISNLKNKSLLNSVPIFSIFIEILIFYYSK